MSRVREECAVDVQGLVWNVGPHAHEDEGMAPRILLILGRRVFGPRFVVGPHAQEDLGRGTRELVWLPGSGRVYEMPFVVAISVVS